MNRPPAGEPLLRQDPAGSRPALGAVGRLAALAAVAAAVVAVARECTRERIADNVSRQALRQLAAILPASLYDNEPQRDVAWLPVSGDGDLQPVFRARRAGQPTAAVLGVVARDGYAGPIRLLVSIDADGHVIGARVAEHQETPGIGDAIEARKSPWIQGFSGHSASEPRPPGWRVRKDGGEFDQITGATVTSRAVVAGTARAVQYFDAHRAEIFAAPAREAGSEPR